MKHFDNAAQRLVLLVTFTLTIAASEAMGQTRKWQLVLPATNVSGVAADSQGGVYIAGTATNEMQALVARLDASGNAIWARTVEPEPPLYTSGIRLADLAATPDGVVVVGSIGGSTSPYDFDVWVRKYDTAGTVQWTRQFGVDIDAGTDVAVGRHGDIYICGYLGDHYAVPPSGSQAFIRKYDPLGNEQWTRVWGDASFSDYAKGIAVSPDETIYVVGEMQTSSSFITGFDSGGNQLWLRLPRTTLPIPGSAEQPLRRVAAGEGVVYAISANTLRRFDTDGNDIWTVTPSGLNVLFPFPDPDFGLHSIAIDGDSKPLVGGQKFVFCSPRPSGGCLRRGFVEGFDLQGMSQWVYPTGSSFAVSRAVDVDKAGDVFAGGTDVINGFVQKLSFQVLQVHVDIRPGSAVNPINLNSQGLVPVAIITTPDFSVTTIRANSVCFGSSSDVNRRDCSEAHDTGHLEDVDSDGNLDHVLHFEIRETGIRPGDTEACVNGFTNDGTAFAGSDTIAVR